jgi:hypothetical protein
MIANFAACLDIVMAYVRFWFLDLFESSAFDGAPELGVDSTSMELEILMLWGLVHASFATS